MKKLLHRRHKSHSPPRGHDDDNDHGSNSALKASLYDDTTSRSPPRMGSTPLKGTQEAPVAASSGMADPRSTVPAAMSPQSVTGRASSRPDQPRDTPTNFSRLPPNRVDAVRAQAQAMRGPSVAADAGNGGRREYAASNVPPSPSAIQPQDLASPEFSYLSNVYGPPAKTRAGPRPDEAGLSNEAHTRSRGAHNAALPSSATPLVSGTDDGRRYAVPSGARTQAAPAAPPGIRELPAMAPDVPRKDVPTSRASGEHSVRSSLDRIPPSVSHVPERKPVAHPEYTVGAGRQTSTAAMTSPTEADRGQAHALALDETADRLKGVVNLNNTVDTEVITKEAPAVVHETIIPKVHEIREERIEREIHTHDVIRRVLPVIDVEVLPPKHFVPTADGGLREVSADELPGRLGHWGIVETVTKDPAHAVRSSAPFPFEPQVLKSEATAGVDDVPRTETVIRHPPTLDTGARDAGQSWPILIAPEVYAERHHLPLINQTNRPSDPTRDPNLPSQPSALAKDLANTGAASVPPATTSISPTTASPVGSAIPGSTGTAPPSQNTQAVLGGTSSASAATLDPRYQALRAAKLAMPGTFPSSTSTSTMKTFQER